MGLLIFPHRSERSGSKINNLTRSPGDGLDSGASKSEPKYIPSYLTVAPWESTEIQRMAEEKITCHHATEGLEAGQGRARSKLQQLHRLNQQNRKFQDSLGYMHCVPLIKKKKKRSTLWLVGNHSKISNDQ